MSQSVIVWCLLKYLSTPDIGLLVERASIEEAVVVVVPAVVPKMVLLIPSAMAVVIVAVILSTIASVVINADDIIEFFWYYLYLGITVSNIQVFSYLSDVELQNKELIILG